MVLNSGCTLSEELLKLPMPGILPKYIRVSGAGTRALVFFLSILFIYFKILFY